MIARISTMLNCTEEKLWTRIIQPGALQYVAAPVLSFIPENPDDFNSEWTTGKEYSMKLFFFSILPLGRHKIYVITIDRKANRIATHESGTLTPAWNHTITFRKIADDRLRYMDEIEIKAGILTVFIWIFAQMFYRHRQRRWKKYLLMDKQ